MAKMLRFLSRSFAFSPKLEFTPGSALQIPTFRTIDLNGEVLPGAEDYMTKLDRTMLNKMLRVMIETEQTDLLYYKLQRINDISFYMQNHGEEGLQAGCAAALDSEDWVYMQYRELGVLLYRGFTHEQLAHQLYSTNKDFGKGRQMPCHFGSMEAKVQTISSPLATQVPQGAGLGYALRLQGKKQICLTFFGDGSASEGDVHAAMNIAATRKAQTLFFCRNNQFAISTRQPDQFSGAGIADRGVGYGIPAIRVDGNDPIAVYFATKASKSLILSQPGPVLLEAMTYRRGHHSTSDDSSLYRSAEELKHYTEVDNPILRFWKFLNKRGLADSSLEELKKTAAETVEAARNVAKKTQKPNWEGMFDDVYDILPPSLLEQKEEFRTHYGKYKNYYEDKNLH